MFFASLENFRRRCETGTRLRSFLWFMILKWKKSFLFNENNIIFFLEIATNLWRISSRVKAGCHYVSNEPIWDLSCLVKNSYWQRHVNFTLRRESRFLFCLRILIVKISIFFLMVYIGEGFGLLIKPQIMLEVSGSKCGCGSKWASVSGRVSSSLRGWQAAQL